ncbi:MAG TPA: YggT family protein [Candidatus Saccharimonadales bacterium]
MNRFNNNTQPGVHTFIPALVSLIFGLIELVLVLRFIFRVVGANPANSFVDWIYDLSSPLIAPFVGIFGSPATTEGAVVASVFEWSSLIGIVVYGVVGMFILKLVTGPARNNGTI